MSEAVNMPSLMMMTLIVSNESLAGDRQIDMRYTGTQTHTYTHTHTHTHTHTYTHYTYSK